MEDQELKHIFQTIRELPPEVDLNGIEQFVLAQPLAIYTYSGPVDGSSWLTFKNLIVMISTVSAVGIGMGVLLLGGGPSSSTAKAPHANNPQQTVAWEDTVPGPGVPPPGLGKPMPPEPLLSAPTMLSSHPVVSNDTAPPLNEILIGPGSGTVHMIPPPVKAPGGECDDEEHVVSVFAKEMEKDGLIAGKKYSFKLNGKGLTVNGKKQPGEVFAKYLELYEKQTGRRMAATMEISVSVAPGDCSISKSNTLSSSSSSSAEAGRIQSGERQKGEFTEIVLESSANIKIIKGSLSEFQVQVSDNGGLQSSVQDNRLYIQGNPGRPDKPGMPHMTVVMPENRLYKIRILGSGNVEMGSRFSGVTSMEIMGSGNVMVNEGVESPDLTVSIMGHGNMTLNGLDVKNMRVLIPGSGNLKAQGRVEGLSVDIKGSGSVSTERLEVRDAKCEIMGSGRIILGNTTGTLSTEISGSGSVLYSGNPTLTKRITGSGSVNKQQAK